VEHRVWLDVLRSSAERRDRIVCVVILHNRGVYGRRDRGVHRRAGVMPLLRIIRMAVTISRGTSWRVKCIDCRFQCIGLGRGSSDKVGWSRLLLAVL
jgi:hypothetical protein